MNEQIEKMDHFGACVAVPRIEHPAVLFEHQHEAAVLRNEVFVLFDRALQRTSLNGNLAVGGGQPLSVPLRRFEFGTQLIDAAFEQTDVKYNLAAIGQL